MAKRRERRKRRRAALGVIWEIPDELWDRIEPILKEYWPAKATGRRTADWRQIVNGIIFRMPRAANGTNYPNGSATTARYIVGSSDGARTV